MASTNRTQFNDSSGTSRSSQPKGIVPKALELPDGPVTRDSGCYTGSPATLVSMTQSPVRQFVFGEGSTSLDQELTPRHSVPGAYPVHSTPSMTSSRGHTEDESTGYTSTEDTPDQFYMDSDVDDDVFDDSLAAFIDSGIQSIGISSGEHLSLPELHGVGEETTSDTETDGESSTEGEEFVTAEFRLEGDDSPVSSPINIPTRSSSNGAHSCESDTEQDLQPRGAAAAASAPVDVYHRPRVLPQLHATERPQSGHGRMQGTGAAESGVMADGRALPDVVPRSLGRSRAFSESALPSDFALRQMGTSLRNISDQFCNMTRTRQRNHLNLVQQLQQNGENETGNGQATGSGQRDIRRNGHSYPTAGRRNSFLGKFFGNSPKE